VIFAVGQTFSVQTEPSQAGPFSFFSNSVAHPEIMAKTKHTVINKIIQENKSLTFSFFISLPPLPLF
jgi:hypothetical protein